MIPILNIYFYNKTNIGQLEYLHFYRVINTNKYIIQISSLIKGNFVDFWILLIFRKLDLFQVQNCTIMMFGLKPQTSIIFFHKMVVIFFHKMVVKLSCAECLTRFFSFKPVSSCWATTATELKLETLFGGDVVVPEGCFLATTSPLYKLLAYAGIYSYSSLLVEVKMSSKK